MSHPELRTDLATGEQVVVARSRADRPGAGVAFTKPDVAATARSCPFCEGREAETPPEIHALADSDRAPDTPGWRVRVVPNKFPAFGAYPAPAALEEPFLAQAAAGAHDVVVHTPVHRVSLAELSPQELALVTSAWSWRGRTAAEAGGAYAHVVVNEGAAAGASLAHTHSQIFSLAAPPPRVAVELARQSAASRCLVCESIDGERRHQARIVSERGGLVAYCPHASRFPYETVVAPLACEAAAFASPLLEPALELAVETLRLLRDDLGWVPVNLWLTTSPSAGGCTHWRLTLAPRLTVMAGLELGAGVSVNPVAPEDAARRLR